MSKAKLFLSVSVIAMFAVGSAWATTPGIGESVSTAHTVYDEETLSGTDDYATTGIAGVSYVNRMVTVAGYAAQEAERHAAAAGAVAEAAAASKQEKLTKDNFKGDGSVSIGFSDSDDVITVTGTTYTAGTNVTIGSDNSINVATANGMTLGVVKQGTNTTITTDGAVNVADATASKKGVSMLGVIPSGADKTGTATIWVE